LFNPQDRPDQYILYQNVEWDMDRDIGTFDSLEKAVHAAREIYRCKLEGVITE